MARNLKQESSEKAMDETCCGVLKPYVSHVNPNMRTANNEG